ncbi:MAG: asparagine synthase (glutamine-hydrolyzing), partial [Chitinivibrionia bacterium]|nr:asparagine synthase (glutamine-hydrolyzing) [Chitinivibrionia bacterium]
FPALRAALIDRGHTFRSRSDCEVIVHLYEELGFECVHKLRGMFAFALWDARTRRLMIARDRIGIKPLYYADHRGTLYFGSEAKAVLVNEEFPREISPEGLHHCLSLNYVPAPFTLVEGLRQILPGEYLVCTEDGTETRTYWDLKFAVNDSLGEREWARAVADKLRSCVESHLVSDVPFGAFLSGGIDSSAVVGYMSELMREPVESFSIDFEEKTYSEARFAREVAGLFGCRHHEMTVSPDVVDLLEPLIWYADDPLADSSMIPVYLLSQFARKHVTMVLTGDGGDEVFAGYDTYNAYFARRYYRMLPEWLRTKVIKRLAFALPVSLTKVSFDYKVKRFVSGAELDAEEAHFWWRAIFTETGKSKLYSPAFRDRLHAEPTANLYRRSFAQSQTNDPLNRMLYVDTRFYLPNDMLVKVDRMTMAHALEARVPFLDHELVALIASIPSSIKFKNNIKKYILKRALAPKLPGDILKRKKAGFNVPINAWLAGDLNAFARDILSRERLGRCGLFDIGHVETMLREHEERKVDHNYRLWGLMCFQIWYELFIEPRAIRPPAKVRERWGLRLE